MVEGQVAALHRFPVKGLSPEPLSAVHLREGHYVPGDRLFAIENGPSGFDEANPVHLPKTRFLMLQRDERLAMLRTAYDAGRDTLSVRLDGALVCEADLADPLGRTLLERFLDGFVGPGRQPARVLTAKGGSFSFTDSSQGFVSLLNLASVRAIEAAVGRPVDPLRFRANIALEGVPAWAENGWVGRRVRVGEAVLAVTALTERCAATGVDPATGARDMNIVNLLVRRFGRNACGVYAGVVEGGRVRAGDTISLLDA